MNYRSNRTFTVELGTGQTVTQLLISLAIASYQLSRQGSQKHAFGIGLMFDPSDMLSISEAADHIHQDALRMLIARGEPCMTALKVERHVGQTVEIKIEMYEDDPERLFALASVVMSDLFPSEEDELPDATEDAIPVVIGKPLDLEAEHPPFTDEDDEVTVEIVVDDRAMVARPLDDDATVDELVAALLADFDDVPTNPCIIRPHDEAVTR
jgi:hypothetical protein